MGLPCNSLDLFQLLYHEELSWVELRNLTFRVLPLFPVAEMESDLPQQQHHHQYLHHSHHPPPGNPGLSRFRSAPSCFFTNILESVLEREFCEDFLNRPSSPETGRILSRLMSGEMDDPAPPPEPAAPNPGNLRRNSPPRKESAVLRPPLAGSIKSEPKVLQQNDFSAAPYYQSSPQPPLPNWNANYEAAKMGRGNNSSNLIRQSSSPAGLFSNINIDSGTVLEASLSMFPSTF